MSIMGNPVGAAAPQPDWVQSDPSRADFIRNKPDFAGLSGQLTELQQQVLPKTGGTLEGGLNMNGWGISGLAQPVANSDAATKAYADSLVKEKFTAQVILPVEGWMAAEEGGFTQQVSCSGIQTADCPHYGIVYSGDRAQRLSQKEAFALVDELETRAGQLLFTCLEDKPAVTITIQLEVNP